MTMRITRVEWFALVFAVLVGHAFLLHEWRYPSAYDAGLYAQIAREIAERGLFHHYSGAEIRIYGYPFFLSLLYKLSVTLGWSFLVVLFEVQLLLYMRSALFFRQSLSFISPLASRIGFVGLLVNYYALIYTPESLTESLSLTLLMFVSGCWLQTYRSPATPLFLIAGTLAASFAMMVRAGNAFIVVGWIVGIVLIAMRKRTDAGRVALAVMYVAVALTLPTLPQLINNTLNFGKRTPLLVEDLGHMQQIWGIQNLKYATALPPAGQGPVYYVSPFWLGTSLDGNSPWRWYLENPGRGFLTLAVHIFNLTDQDLLFTYARDLDPWYRLPLGILNYSAVALGLVGLAFVGCRLRRRPEAAQVDAYLTLLVLIGAYLVVYSWTAVEMRFGAPLLLVLFPFAGYAIVRMIGVRDARTITVAGIALGVYVVASFVLSAWVRNQSELIRGLRVEQQYPPRHSLQLASYCPIPSWFRHLHRPLETPSALA